LNVTIKIIKIGLYLPQIKVAHLMSRSTCSLLYAQSSGYKLIYILSHKIMTHRHSGGNKFDRQHIIQGGPN